MADETVKKVKFRGLDFSVEVKSLFQFPAPHGHHEICEVDVSHELWCRTSLMVSVVENSDEAVPKALTELYRLVSYHHSSCAECLAYIVSELLDPEEDQ